MLIYISMKRVINLLLNKEKMNEIIHSNLFLLIISSLLFLSWATNIALISMITIVLTIATITIYNKDSQVLGALLPLTMITFPTLPSFSSIPWYLIIELSSFFIGFIIIVIKNIKQEKIKFSLGSIGFSILFLGIMGLLCEIIRKATAFNSESNFNSYGLIGALFVILIALAYVFFHLTGINNRNGYFFKVFYFTNIILILEAIFIYISNDFVTIDFTLLKWGEKNAYALMLEICVPFIAYMFSRSKRRFDYIALCVIDYFFIIISISRGGSITALILLPLLIYIGLYNQKKLKKLYPIVLLTSYSLIPLCYLIFPVAKESINQMLSHGLNLTNRDIIWNDALTFYKNNPIFGGGISALFDLNVLQNGPKNYLFFPHNTLVTLLSTCGILGVVSFIILLYEVIITIYNYKDKEKFIYIFFILVGLIHGIIDNTFYSVVYMLPLIYIFANNNLKGIEYRKIKGIFKKERV